MGWSREGADKLCHVRIYWKNGGDMQELLQKTKEGKREEKQTNETYFSSSEILSWEKKHGKTNGKYIEALQASISRQISGKLTFYTAISNIC